MMIEGARYLWAHFQSQSFSCLSATLCDGTIILCGLFPGPSLGRLVSFAISGLKIGVEQLGHEVIVANVRELRAISHGDHKSDDVFDFAA